MMSKFAEMTPRNFSPKLTPELSDEARKAVNAAFEAMSTWRTETVDSFETVIDKMAAAARALGWPQQIIDASRAQMEGVIKMQVQTMDRMMDAWEGQIKSPGSSSAILSKLQSIPGFSAAGWPSAALGQMEALNPFGMYMQMAQQWQKTWADTVGVWANADKPINWRT
jgi:uncharacterized membrane protein